MGTDTIYIWSNMVSKKLSKYENIKDFCG